MQYKPGKCVLPNTYYTIQCYDFSQCSRLSKHRTAFSIESIRSLSNLCLLMERKCVVAVMLREGTLRNISADERYPSLAQADTMDAFSFAHQVSYERGRHLMIVK